MLFTNSRNPLYIFKVTLSRFCQSKKYKKKRKKLIERINNFLSLIPSRKNTALLFLFLIDFEKSNDNNGSMNLNESLGQDYNSRRSRSGPRSVLEDMLQVFPY